MSLSLWLSFVLVCFLGTISPGPSLAVVLRQSLGNGRKHGVVTAMSHSTGVALWAVLTLWGLGVVVAEHPTLYQVITYSGAVYLAWLGIKALRSMGGIHSFSEEQVGSYLSAVSDGALISLMNPKLALFFIALFSQFLSADQTLVDQLILLSTVVLIDLIWFSWIAIMITQGRLLKILQNRSKELDRVSGVVMIGLALRIAL
ncbi:LysE family translocator [uncultured Neptuniibacter sp.]|uniref:LysE family translocator n=1 Tax=uncultured Neptuniibacter sp. TaxID=502143 RepID=UPI0026085C5A|nr:LysE family translocator [uncultured Neptuniibacter sp.]